MLAEGHDFSFLVKPGYCFLLRFLYSFHQQDYHPHFLWRNKKSGCHFFHQRPDQTASPTKNDLFSKIDFWSHALPRASNKTKFSNFKKSFLFKSSSFEVVPFFQTVGFIKVWTRTRCVWSPIPRQCDVAVLRWGFVCRSSTNILWLDVSFKVWFKVSF